MEPIKVYAKVELKDYLIFRYSCRSTWLYAWSVALLSLALFSVSESYIMVIKTLSIVFLFELVCFYQERSNFYADKDCRNEYLYYFSEEKIVEESIDGSSSKSTKWSELHKAILVGSCLILYSTKARAYIIPKRFLSREQMKVLNDIVKESYNPKGIKNFRYVRFCLIILGEATIGFWGLIYAIAFL